MMKNILSQFKSTSVEEKMFSFSAKIFYFSVISILFILIEPKNAAPIEKDITGESIYVSINPTNHFLDINWFDVTLQNDSLSYFILITNGSIKNLTTEDFLDTTRWIIDEGVDIIYEMAINSSSGTQQTTVKFDFTSYRRIDHDKGCYSYWYHLVVEDELKYSWCMTTKAKWMNDMRDKLENKKFRQLFIPGTHDSASYKYNFDPLSQETLITRYTLTQDDDILSQLIHGIRYIDLRIGYYRSTKEKFWVNHGISRLHPLSEVLTQIKQFVDATNEIVIVDFQEFPVGFNRGSEVHKQLVFNIFQQMSEYAVDPEHTWDSTLGEIWRTGKRVILAYDHQHMVQNEGLGILWPSVRQRWGKVKDSSEQLIKFLRESRSNMTREFQTSRPFAEMAELTPEAVDVLTNRLGGLRKMADKVNFDITRLYSSEFGKGCNILAVDFYRSTNIVDIALKWNSENSKI